MTSRTLEVWCLGERAGHLADDGRRLSFTYDSAWIAGGRPALSQALPADGEFGEDHVHAFFEGLLPEGELRRLIASRLGVSAGNEFSLLERIGGDCAGAISLYPPGAAPRAGGGSVSWLDDAAVVDLVRELPQRPMYAGADGEYRLSLAGAQDKLPVVVDGGRIGLPAGGRPSTHILKTPIARLPATVLNEALWSRVGERLGIECARSLPHRVGDVEMLLVERYDRRRGATGDVERLHQEDFCQALGIDSDHKYEREGGPGLPDCFRLLRRVSRTPGVDLPRLVDAWALSFVAANHDAHGKNFSLLYRPDGVALAPVYDVLNTLGYRGLQPMDRKMAMQIGGEYRPDYVRRRHLERMISDAGLGSAATRRRLRALLAQAPAAVDDARRDLAAEFWDHEHLGAIVQMAHVRVRTLLGAIDEGL